jgi:GDP-mannose 6-dehydrogenase
MNISIFGLGYVGCVSLGCLALKEHNLIGVDISQSKIDLINSGKPTIIEEGIEELIINAFNKNQIRATRDYLFAVENTDISFICVGTPSSKNGHLDLSYVFTVAEQIASGIKTKTTFHTIVIRSTVEPGTNKLACELIQNISGKKKNIDFAVVSNPEFLREGSAVNDYFNPPYTLLASESEKGLNVCRKLYEDLGSPIEIKSIKVAELIKYVNNSFHALKISFANEVGNICKALQIDSHELMNVFVKDTQLNISEAYLRPGFAYGGSCLPKDLKGLNTIAHDNYVKVPVLASIQNSNEYQKDLVLDSILSKNIKEIGFWGISFKEGTDDLRFSPVVDLLEKLLGKGFQISIFDKNVSFSNLNGVNRSFILNYIPHIEKLLCNSPEKMIGESGLIVFPHKIKGLEKYVPLLEDKTIIDLARNPVLETSINYHGLSW